MTAPYQILKAQYEGQLAHDQGLLSQAQMDLKRYQTLAQQNSIARQQSEDQVFIVQQYQGTVKQDQALIDAQTLNIAYCHIISPVTGRVGLAPGRSRKLCADRAARPASRSSPNCSRSP